jgi:preprotein translocase subunit YajC
MGMIVMLLVLFAIFYFIGLRPQQKQAKRHRELMGAINERDKVITSAGILGTITKMEGDIVTLQLDKNTSIQMLKDHIRGKQSDSE